MRTLNLGDDPRTSFDEPRDAPRTQRVIYEDGREVHEPVLPKLRLRKRPKLRLRNQAAARAARPRLRKPTTKNKWRPGEPLPKTGYSKLPRAVFTSNAYKRLGYPAKVLLVGLLTQCYHGQTKRDSNNGRLVATMSWVHYNIGWPATSTKTLSQAIYELLESELIKRTRDRSRDNPAWYRLNWDTTRRRTYEE